MVSIDLQGEENASDKVIKGYEGLWDYGVRHNPL